MNSYQFAGHISPSGLIEINDFSLKSEDTYGFDTNLQGEIDLSIHADKVIVKYKTDQNFDSDLETLKNSLEYFCKAVIDSCNYFYGTGVDLYLIIGGNTTKQPYTFPPKVNSIFAEQNKRPVSPLQITELAVKNVQLRRTLEQLKNAITNPVDAGLSCYRAVEAMRRTFLDGTIDDGAHKKRSWEKMNKCLRLNSTYYALSKSHADVARHGGIKSATSAEMEEMLHRTWNVVDRYLIYLTNGENALDESFEELV